MGRDRQRRNPLFPTSWVAEGYDRLTGRDAQVRGPGGAVDRVTPGGATGPVRERTTNPSGIEGLDGEKVTGRDNWKPHAEKLARYIEKRWGTWCENGHKSYLPKKYKTSIDVWGGTGFRPLARNTGDEISAFLTSNFRGVSLGYFIWYKRIWDSKSRRFRPLTEKNYVHQGDDLHVKHLHITLTDEPGDDFGEVGGIQGAAGDAADTVGGAIEWLGANLWKAIARGIAEGAQSVWKVFFYYTILAPVDRLAGFFHELYLILTDKLNTSKSGGDVFSELNLNRFYLAMLVGITYFFAFGSDKNGMGKLRGLLQQAGQRVGGAGKLAARRGAGRGRNIPGKLNARVMGGVSAGESRKRRATYAEFATG